MLAGGTMAAGGSAEEDEAPSPESDVDWAFAMRMQDTDVLLGPDLDLQCPFEWPVQSADEAPAASEGVGQGVQYARGGIDMQP